MNFQNNDQNKSNPNSWQGKIDPTTGGWKQDSLPGGSQQGSSGNTNESTSSGKQSVVNLLIGGGVIRGMGEKFQANPVTGAGSFTVPLAISPERSGFTPQLALSYDSGSGNGPFGLGWIIVVPSVSRKTHKGLPLFEDFENHEFDTFILSGAEDLVPVLREEVGMWIYYFIC